MKPSYHRLNDIESLHRRQCCASLLSPWTWLARLTGPPKPYSRRNVRVVCISDTHGHHRELTAVLPKGDVLIHAGDYTSLGDEQHAYDFNDWLGEVGRDFKAIVVAQLSLLYHRHHHHHGRP